jgi:hypothetical protein
MVKQTACNLTFKTMKEINYLKKANFYFIIKGKSHTTLCRRKRMYPSRNSTIYATVEIPQTVFLSAKSANVLCCKYAKDSRENPRNITGGLFYQLRWLALFCAGNTNT